MKERPILFSGAMVRAILEGRKTVTRRVVKGLDPERLGETMTRAQWRQVNRELPESFGITYLCPYGKPGDRLWVRETWARVGNTDPGYLVYRATYPACLPPGLERVPADIRDAGYRWRPSIHMPRAASRILLEITAVRVERLHGISRGDAMAEGCPFPNMAAGPDPRQWFAELWQEINGADSWAANPWVWVLEFKRVQEGSDV